MMEVIHQTHDGHNLFAEVERSAEPDNHVIHFEVGCNEIWLDIDDAKAIRDYIEKWLPTMTQASGEFLSAPDPALNAALVRVAELERALTAIVMDYTSASAMQVCAKKALGPEA